MKLHGFMTFEYDHIGKSMASWSEDIADNRYLRIYGNSLLKGV